MISGQLDDLTTTSSTERLIIGSSIKDTTEVILVTETKTESKNGQKQKTSEEKAWIFSPSKFIWVPQSSPRKVEYVGGMLVQDYGPWKFPTHPKVGDVLEIVYNCTYNYLNDTKIGSRDVVVGHTAEAYSKTDFGWFNDGGMKFGNYYETGIKFTPIIKKVYAEVETKVEGALTSFNRANAEVTGIEEYSIHGNKYTAYIVKSQSWIIPLSIGMSAASTDKIIQENFQKIMDKTTKLINGKDRGYITQDIIEYVVPELGGSVKSIVYENGFVRLITTLTDIK
jgi:hypothetical protein